MSLLLFLKGVPQKPYEIELVVCMCCYHSVGPNVVDTCFTYIVLVKGVFSPNPPYCGYFIPSHLSLPCCWFCYNNCTQRNFMLMLFSLRTFRKKWLFNPPPHPSSYPNSRVFCHSVCVTQFFYFCLMLHVMYYQNYAAEILPVILPTDYNLLAFVKTWNRPFNL